MYRYIAFTLLAMVSLVFCGHRASLINHNCQPNSVVVFEGLTLNVHTVQDMQANGNSEVQGYMSEGGRRKEGGR